MMYKKLNSFGTDQVVTTTAASTDIIDPDTSRNKGNGETLELVVLRHAKVDGCRRRNSHLRPGDRRQRRLLLTGCAREFRHRRGKPRSGPEPKSRA